MKEFNSTVKEPKKRGRKPKVSDSSLSAVNAGEKNAYKSRKGSGKASMTPDSSARKLPDILISKRTGDKRETLGKRRSKLVDKQFQNLKASNDLAAPKEIMTP